MDSAVPPDAWRLEWRCIKYGLPALALGGILGFPYLGRDAIHWFPLFLLWTGWLLGVPAWAIARRLKSQSPLERLGFGITLSVVGLALFQFAAFELGERSLLFAYPLLVRVGSRRACEPSKVSTSLDGSQARREHPMPRTALLGGLLAFAMALGVMAMLPSFFPARAPVLDEHRQTRCLKLLPDILLHLQAQEEMSHTWPPQLSPAAGVPLRYHLAADAITLALTPPGVPRLAVNCHYMPAFWHLLMAGNSLLLARRYLGATWLAGLFPILAVFGEDFGWLVPELELQMVPSLPTFPSFFWYNPNLPGLAVLMGGLASLGWATSVGRARPANKDAGHARPTKSAIFVPACLLGGAALFKVFIGVQAGFAVAFALMLCGQPSRRTLFAILGGLALFGGMLGFLYRHTFEAPNQHFRFEILAEMRMSYWFVPVVLGFRILGLGELMRIPMWAKQEGPLRVAIVGLVLTGMVGLFVRISAMLMPGVLGYNNGVWLSVVAKVPMWLLVLGAIQRWNHRSPHPPTPSPKQGGGVEFPTLPASGRVVRNANRVGWISLPILITLVAVRGSWPFLKFQWENPEAPHLIAPDDLEVPQWLKRSVPLGTVVACDPSFPLSLTALSPYRTPCPQGGEFAYAISFMTSQDHAVRVSDADQFWGEWSCGGLPEQYLAKYRVRWVITRADLGCPEGLQPVFRNGSWAIFAGNSFNSELTD